MSVHEDVDFIKCSPDGNEWECDVAGERVQVDDFWTKSDVTDSTDTFNNGIMIPLYSATCEVDETWDERDVLTCHR